MPTSLPEARESRVIFSRGERNFNAREVVDAALVRGEIAPLWSDFVRVLECDRLAAEEDLELDDDAIDSASISFRYQHDLITAEETERWLEDRGLSLAEFSDYFARHHWGRTYSGKVNPPASRYETAGADEKDLFLIDLILSDRLDRLADRLGFRIAALAAENDKVDPIELADARGRFMTKAKLDRVGLEQWLAHLGRDMAWLDEMLSAEVAYATATSALINDQALARELNSMRLNLTRFELETVEVDSRDAAAEVVACVRNDGMEMSEVAQESRYPFHQSEVLLEDIPADQQQRFFSVKAGTLFEPIPREDAFEVWRVKARVEPSLQDEAIRERLERLIIDRHFSDLISRHIDWRYLSQPGE